MNKLLSSMVVMVVCAFFSVGAYGATQTTTLDVSVNFVSACAMTVTGVAFPTYVGDSVFANGDVTVNCAAGVPYNIALDAGLHPGAGYRSVTNISNNYILYALFKDGGLTQAWGDADFFATYLPGTSLADTGSGIAEPHTVYGVLAPSGAGPPGLYTDTVTVTLYY